MMNDALSDPRATYGSTVARHKSACTFIHNLLRVSPENQYIITCCCRCNSDSVALLKKIAADGLYRCT